MRGRRRRAAGCCALALLCGAALADTQPDGDDASAWNLHGQDTNVTQWHPSFRAPYSGTNSLQPDSRSAETTDATLYLGLRPWRGGEFYLNPEVEQGFGLSDTLGVAGFPSAEAYKVGTDQPYVRMQRAFLRQVIDLGGSVEEIDDDANQLAGTHSSDNLTITVGKFSVVDLFDTNRYAHDPRGDFLNWSFVDAGAFDYAADAWGYTVGAAVEWTRGWWTLRAGLFDFSAEPNSERLDPHFGQYQWVGEFEAR